MLEVFSGASPAFRFMRLRGISPRVELPFEPPSEGSASGFFGQSILAAESS